MRYHYKKPDFFTKSYGEIYCCDHPIYNKCTLFKIGDYGLAVIQQRFNRTDKTTYWSNIDPWIANDIYLNERFKQYFDDRSGKIDNGLYPSVTVRQIMWALKIKPIPKQRWETVFDRKDI